MITLLWCSATTKIVMATAFKPTERKCRITKVSPKEVDGGRSVLGIEGDESFVDWYLNSFPPERTNIIREKLASGVRPIPLYGDEDQPINHPIARVVRGTGFEGAPCYYQTFQPVLVMPEDAVLCGTDVEVGDEIVFMQEASGGISGCFESIFKSFTKSHKLSGFILNESANLAADPVNAVADIERMCQLGVTKPFVGSLPLGEQGVDPFGTNRHHGWSFNLLMFGKEIPSRTSHTGGLSSHASNATTATQFVNLGAHADRRRRK